MAVKNLSWQQIVVFVVCLGAAFAAYKWLGLSEGAAGMIVTSIIAFLMGRDGPPNPPPPAPPSPPSNVIGFTAAALVLVSLVACGTPLEAKDPGDVIAKCEAEARAEYYVGGATVDEALAVFDACMAREAR